VLIVGILGLVCRTGLAQAPAGTGQQLKLLAFGDWGAETPARQQVADSMAAYCAKSAQPIDLALSLGDNFYVPVASADDPIFQKWFENAYDRQRMNFPFYVLLGNHDYQIDGDHARYEAEMDYAVKHPESRWKLPARWYRLDLPKDHPLVTILLLDSNHDNPVKYSSLTVQQWQAELYWIEKQLSGPRAPWTICCAHHIVYSNGKSGDNGVLVTQWASLFKQYNVDFYMSGHDHTMQHLEINGAFTSFVVSGGGGQTVDEMLRDNRGPFSRSVSGFAAASFTPDQATVELLDGSGTIVHAFTRTKTGVVTVTLNTPSEPRAANPLRVIEGFPAPAATGPAK
jgi:hypothetical protein